MRVLIVDDEPHVLLWDVLASCGYMVHAVDNGAEALKTIHQWRPDAILLDLIMPVLDGCTFLEAFASDPECRGVPLAVVSAAPDTGAAIQDHGVRAIIPKPFDVEVLVSTVGELVRHSRLHHEPRCASGDQAGSHPQSSRLNGTQAGPRRTGSIRNPRARMV